MDNSVRLWNPHTGESLGAPLKGHTKWVTALAWEPYHLWNPAERPRLASSSKDSTVRVWDVVSKRIELVLSGHKGSVSCVRWGGTGNIYTSSHDKTVKIWSSATGQLINTLSSHAHWVNHLALSTDFALRTAYYDEKGTSSVPSTLEAKRDKARKRFDAAATFSGAIVERLVTASDDFTIFLWHPSTGTKPIARLQGHQKQVNDVTFSPDGTLIASSAFDNHIKLWSARVSLHFYIFWIIPQCVMATVDRIIVPHRDAFWQKLAPFALLSFCQNLSPRFQSNPIMSPAISESSIDDFPCNPIPPPPSHIQPSHPTNRPPI